MENVSNWDSKTPKRPVIQVPDSSPADSKTMGSPDEKRYKHTYLFSKKQPAEEGSSLREKFAFNGTNILSNNSNNVSSMREKDIAILEKLFKTINPNLIRAVYKTKGNHDLKLSKHYLTELVERRKQQEMINSMNQTSNGSKAPVVISSSPEASPQKASSKVVLNKSKTISQKYSAYNEKQKQRELSPEPPVQKKRRLVRGSRNPNPVVISDASDDSDDENVKPATKKPNPSAANPLQKPAILQNIDLSEEEEENEAILNDDFSDDEDVEESSMVNNSSLDEYFERKVLEFLNSAPERDIADSGGCTLEVASAIVSKRPFRSINQFEALNFSEKAKAVSKGKRKSEGEMVSQKTNLTLRGYSAVENLVKQCNSYSEIIAKEINKWGVKVHGVTDELEIVDIDGDDQNEEDEEIKVSSRRKVEGFNRERPTLLAPDVELKNYQQVGLNWLTLLYQNKLSCILADEMGLGKTCQVIAFLAYLKEKGVKKGPHLVVVPSSTLENWLREFNKFAPSLRIEPYYGSQPEREEMREVLAERLDEIDVIVTTYNLATGQKEDQSFLRHCGFNVIVYDEGHMLKNSASERFSKLMKLKGRFRLLLTGTPLQNNLRELMSLLEFILPSLFVSKKEDLKYVFNQKAKTYNNDQENYNPLLSERAISKAKRMMAPFILRRRKDQVLKYLPPKHHEIQYAIMTETQKALYKKEIEHGIELKKQKKQSSNVIMSLRKAAIHPLLFRHVYSDDILRKMTKDILTEEYYKDANSEYVFEDMQVLCDYELDVLCSKFPSISKYQLSDEQYMNSGKVIRLKEILPGIVSSGGKILIFSLFTQVLDILERVLSNLSIQFLRLDGSTAVDIRQDLIDKFYEEKNIPVFLLSTKAGGFGINLVCANTVIIFDQSFNPHDDKQAEDRAHRVGQLKPVDVIRLISKNTIEENMLQLAHHKLELDKSMSGEQLENKSLSYIEQMVFNDNDAKATKKDVSEEPAAINSEDIPVFKSSNESEDSPIVIENSKSSKENPNLKSPSESPLSDTVETINSKSEDFKDEEVIEL